MYQIATYILLSASFTTTPPNNSENYCDSSKINHIKNNQDKSSYYEVKLHIHKISKSHYFNKLKLYSGCKRYYYKVLSIVRITSIYIINADEF